MLRRLFFLLILAACSKQEPEPNARADAKPPTRDEWWKQATAMPSGAERILAPRELRALLVAGKVHGFDTDRSWWTERTNYVYDRIRSSPTFRSVSKSTGSPGSPLSSPRRSMPS